MKKPTPEVLEKRVVALRALLASDPNDDVALFGLGKALIALGRPADAEPELRRLLEIRPDYTAAYRELGRSLLAMGEVGAAQKVLEEGCEVARETGDLQTGREMQVQLRRAIRTVEGSRKRERARTSPPGRD